MQRPKRTHTKPMTQKVADILVERMLDFSTATDIEEEFELMKSKARTPADRLTVTRLQTSLNRFRHKASQNPRSGSG